MKLKLPRRTKPEPRVTARQRRASADLQPATSYAYHRAKRSETEGNTGRQAQREAIKAVGAQASQFWFQRFGLVILLLAAIFSAVNILTLSSSAKVLPLSNNDKQSFLRDESTYEATASQILQSSILNRNKLTVNSAQLSQQMLEQFPELSNVNVTVPLLAHRPLIYIQAAQPALIIVGSSSGSFLLDTSGKALLTAANAAALKQPTLPVVTDQSSLQISLNHQALPATSIIFITEVLAQLAAKHIQIGALTLPAAASELDVQIAGQPYLAKFNLQAGDGRQQVGTLLATMAQLQKQNTVPAKYIDVRIDGRAYYQ